MKTPKREHWCRWCCGPVDVHLDPSGETEEYSICRVCHRKTSSNCGHTWEPYKEHARWTRKNREKRLKHALQRQAWNAVTLAADLRCAELSARSWKKRYREIWRMQFWTTSAYGQDIEGS